MAFSSSSSSSSSSSTTTPLTTVDHGGGSGISAVHPDIVQTHILTRLDGPTLASAACASSHLHALSTEEKLWRDICASAWPSIENPRDTDSLSLPAELISAVDVHYEDELIFSKVQETRTGTETETETARWFLCAPFRVELIDRKESVQTPIRQVGEDKAWLKHLEENLKLSWIVIDPTRKKATNVSSGRPVSVQRHWFTGDILLRYATIMAGEKSDFVQCAVVVTCGEKVGGELELREVSMLVEDMEGKHVKGRDSLVILKAAMESGKRKERKGEGKERFEAYLEMKKVRSERKQRRERAVDMALIVTGITIFVAFWSFLCFR